MTTRSSQAIVLSALVAVVVVEVHETRRGVVVDGHDEADVVSIQCTYPTPDFEMAAGGDGPVVRGEQLVRVDHIDGLLGVAGVRAARWSSSPAGMVAASSLTRAASGWSMVTRVLAPEVCIRASRSCWGSWIAFGGQWDAGVVAFEARRLGLRWRRSRR